MGGVPLTESRRPGGEEVGGAGSHFYLGRVHFEMPVSAVSVDGGKRETEKECVARDKDRCVPSGFDTGQLVGGRTQAASVSCRNGGWLEWVEEGKGDEEPATESVNSSEVFLW